MSERSERNLKIKGERLSKLEHLKTEKHFEDFQDAVFLAIDRGLGEKTETESKAPVTCIHVSDDGTLCGLSLPKFRKTNPSQCRLCLKEREVLGVLHSYRYASLDELFNRLNTVIGEKDTKIAELRKPQQRLLDRIAELENMKNSLLSRLDEIAVLETDNERLRKENEELSQDRLVEKNSFLNVEVGKLNKTIEDLKTEVEKTQALADTRGEKLNSVLSQFSKALRDFKEYCPTTAEPYQMHDYIDKMQKKCQDLEGFINTLTA